jgi:hypothetical protein
MTSTVYRQSARQTEGALASKALSVDSDNHLLWRMNLRRLEAEALRDAVIAVSGKLDRSIGGPPLMLKARPDGLETVSDEAPANARWRRSVYLVARRTYPLNFLGVFDYPIIDASCTRRIPSATPLQSLTLLNSEFMAESAGELAARATQLAGENAPAAEKIAAVYSLALARRPVKAEVDLGEEHLRKQEELYRQANVAAPEASRRALESLAHMVLSSNEFLYID